MSKLPIFGGMLYDQNEICPHNKIANTVQTIVNHNEPIRLTEMSRLRKLGDCKQNVHTCLWSLDAVDSIADENDKLQLLKPHRDDKDNNSNNSCKSSNYSSSNNSSKHSSGNSYPVVLDPKQQHEQRTPQRFCKPKSSVLDKMRDGIRKYRNHMPEEKTPINRSSLTWILKPRRHLRVSKTSLVHKYNAAARKLAKINGVPPCLIRNASKCDLNSKTMSNLLKMAVGTYKSTRGTTLASPPTRNVNVPKSKKNYYNEKQRQQTTEMNNKTNKQRLAQKTCNERQFDKSKVETTQLEERLCQEPKCRLYKMERVEPSKIRVIKYNRPGNSQKPNSNATKSPQMNASLFNIDAYNIKTATAPAGLRNYCTPAQSSKSVTTPTSAPLVATQISLVQEMGIDEVVKELTVPLNSNNMAPQSTENAMRQHQPQMNASLFKLVASNIKTMTPTPLVATQISLLQEMGIDQVVKELTVPVNSNNLASQFTENVMRQHDCDGAKKLALRRFQCAGEYLMAMYRKEIKSKNAKEPKSAQQRQERQQLQQLQQQKQQELQQRQQLQQQKQQQKLQQNTTHTPPQAEQQQVFYVQPVTSIKLSPKLCKQPQIPRQKGGADLTDGTIAAAAAANERKMHGIRKGRRLTRRFKNGSHKIDRKTRHAYLLEKSNSLSSELRESLTSLKRFKNDKTVTDNKMIINIKENGGETRVTLPCGKAIRDLLTVLTSGAIEPIRVRTTKPPAKKHRHPLKRSDGTKGDTRNSRNESVGKYHNTDYTISYHTPIKLHAWRRQLTKS